MSEVTPSPNVCKHCGKTIVLKPSGQHYKWFSVRGVRGKTLTWKCPAPGFPVRSHSPAQTGK